MKTYWIIIALSFSINLLSGAPLKPHSKNKPILLVGKNTHTYYQCKKKIVYNVQGPGELDINVRSFLEDSDSNSKPSTLQIIINDDSKESHVISNLKKSKLIYNNEGLVKYASSKRQIKIDVPPGQHKFEIRLDNNKSAFISNAYFNQCPSFQWSQESTPRLKNAEEVVFPKTQKIRKYTKLSKDNELKLDVGDTDWTRITLRPLFTPRMLDEVIYRVRIQNLKTGDRKEHKIYAKKSLSTETPTSPNKSVGRAHQIILPSHQGLEKFSITLISGTSEALVKVDTSK